MHRFPKTLLAVPAILLALFSCSLDDVVDTAEAMKNNLYGSDTETVSTEVTTIITENTETSSAGVTTETDEEGNTSVSVSVGDISVNVTVEGDFSLDLSDVTIISTISSEDLQTLAVALEENAESLVAVVNAEASEELAEAVSSTCSVIANVVEVIDVTAILESTGLDEELVTALDNFITGICSYTDEDTTITQGDVLMVQLVTSTVYSLADEIVSALSEDGSSTLTLSEDLLTEETLEVVLEAATNAIDDILEYTSVLVSVSSVISGSDSENSTALADGITSLYSSIAPYLDSLLGL